MAKRKEVDSQGYGGILNLLLFICLYLSCNVFGRNGNLPVLSYS